MRIFTIVLLIFILSINAAAIQSESKAEITHLLTYIETTQCQYIRNGDRHNGPEAVAHINKKYDYYRDDIDSAEDFIRLSATKSMISGSKYYIKCPGSAKVESSKWLQDELGRYREQ